MEGQLDVVLEGTPQRPGALFADPVAIEDQLGQHRVGPQRLGDRNGALVADAVAAEVEGFQDLVAPQRIGDRSRAL